MAAVRVAKKSNASDRSSKKEAVLNKWLLARIICYIQTLKRWMAANALLKKISLHERMDGSN